VIELTVVIMALVNPQGQVVSKIVVDTDKQYTLPPGWSMHEWTNADEIAFQQYLASLKATT